MASSFLADVLIILAAAVILVPLAERLRVGAVVGYLAAGVIIGPGGLGLIADVEAPQAIGALGVVFLMFTLGLEFTRERLRLTPAGVYGLGIAKVLVTATALATAAAYAGFDWPVAVLIGASLALSSTAIVLPVLGDIGKLTVPMGQLAVTVLLLEDLAVGPILVLVETLGRGDGPLWLALGLAVVKAAAAIAAIVGIGYLLLRPLFRLVAGVRSPELFAGTVLLVALATAGGTELAGLSMAFGGFLAGLLLAETEFRHQVAADVEPFRGLLLGLFFMSVGMSVNTGLLAGQSTTILALAAGLMVAKGLIVLLLAMAFGSPPGRALRLGGMLAQGSELAFVTFGAAAAAGLMEAEEAGVLIAMVAVTMMVTPVAVKAGMRLLTRLERRGVGFAAELAGEVLDVRRHVIIAGYGEIGAIVARMLKAYGVPYVILDLNPERVRRGRASEEPVFFGDATRPEVLQGVCAGDALAVVVATDAPGVAEALAAIRRHQFPELPMIVRGGGEADVAGLRRSGLIPVGQEATDTGLKLTGAVLDLWHDLDGEAPG
ncbi:MAG: potassium transporter KefB [Rhodospirillales bacterium]|nr:MAG: potassium transporter KefB [Rhodospirillales bacterium]